MLRPRGLARELLLTKKKGVMSVLTSRAYYLPAYLSTYLPTFPTSLAAQRESSYGLPS